MQGGEESQNITAWSNWIKLAFTFIIQNFLPVIKNRSIILKDIYVIYAGRNVKY